MLKQCERKATQNDTRISRELFTNLFVCRVVCRSSLQSSRRPLSSRRYIRGAMVRFDNATDNAFNCGFNRKPVRIRLAKPVRNRGMLRRHRDAGTQSWFGWLPPRLDGICVEVWSFRETVEMAWMKNDPSVVCSVWLVHH